MLISFWLPGLYCGLLTSLLFGVSANNWFTLFVCMELNLIMILPLLFYSSNLVGAESVIIYLLSQSVGSLLILMSILLDIPLFTKFTGGDMLLFVALLLKFGVVPLHFWFVGLLSFSQTVNFFMLSTTQKILPILMMMNTELNHSLIFILLLSTFVPIINVMSNKMKIMLAYSSVFQMTLFFVALQSSEKVGYFYFGVYVITIGFVCYWLIYLNNKNYIGAMTENKTKLQSVVALAMLMGLPPFSMFIPKIYLLMSSSGLILLVLILFFVMTVNMFIYLRVVSQVSLFAGSLTNLSSNLKSDLSVMVGLNILPWLLLF